MSGIRAKVKNGRLVLDVPTTLPEGTVLDLVLDDEGDDLDEEDRRALNATISKSWDSAKAGEVRPAREVLDEIKSRK